VNRLANSAVIHSFRPDYDPAVDEYARGFSRALVLRSSDVKAKYSPRFEEALLNYFESTGLRAHPKFSEWWADHSGLRVAHAFNVFIPWCLDLGVNFEGARVLEIGCGTGSSTVALAAYAKHVTACDVHRPSIDVARIRVKEDGFAHKVDFVQLDATLNELSRRRHDFDVVVFYGVLEHMLPNEREQTFRSVWTALKDGGKVVIYETPNRLWPKDNHTTDLMGWSWLPPDLALRYGKLRGRFAKHLDVTAMRRLGYGMTYADLLKLINDPHTKIHYKYVREPFLQRAVAKSLTTLLRAPRWGFSEYLNLVIEKT